MPEPLRFISSMATRGLLNDLAAAWQGLHPDRPVAVESVGGVDAARRVRAGEAFDGIVLASNTIEALLAEGHARAGSGVDLVRSGIAVAVRAGAAAPDIGSEEALRRAVQSAATVGYSTGPSGVYLQSLFERWGLAADVAARTVQAPPGVPVGRLVAEGQVGLGFQQLSELLGLPGITVLGPLPAAVQHRTVFSGAVAQASARPDAARAVLAFWAGAQHDALRQRHGMESAV